MNCDQGRCCPRRVKPYPAMPGDELPECRCARAEARLDKYAEAAMYVVAVLFFAAAIAVVVTTN